MFTCGTPPPCWHLMATEARTVDKRTVRILLECFLVSTAISEIWKSNFPKRTEILSNLRLQKKHQFFFLHVIWWFKRPYRFESFKERSRIMKFSPIVLLKKTPGYCLSLCNPFCTLFSHHHWHNAKLKNGLFMYALYVCTRHKRVFLD